MILFHFHLSLFAKKQKENDNLNPLIVSLEGGKTTDEELSIAKSTKFYYVRDIPEILDQITTETENNIEFGNLMSITMNNFIRANQRTLRRNSGYPNIRNYAHSIM